MSRQLRIEFPGALHHVTSRGNAGRRMFIDADDGAQFMSLLEREVRQQGWLCHAFCLMEDHYHLLVETPEPNLGRGMRRLNMSYAQCFNRRHGSTGHLFGDRYKSISVDPNMTLAMLARHMVLNPVRRNLVHHARQWRWSSYQVTAFGTGAGASWVCTERVLAQIAPGSGDIRGGAMDYAAFVDAGLEAPSPWLELRAGRYLGGEAFLGQMAERVKSLPADQVSARMLNPGRPTADQIQQAVSVTAQVPFRDVLDRRSAREPFHVTVFLLRRAANLPLARVASMSHVSPGRISQIQRAIEDAGGLARAFPWAVPLAKRYEL